MSLSNNAGYNERVRRYKSAYQKGYHDYDLRDMYKNDCENHEFIAYASGWEARRRERSWLDFKSKFLNFNSI